MFFIVYILVFIFVNCVQTVSVTWAAILILLNKLKIPKIAKTKGKILSHISATAKCPSFLSVDKFGIYRAHGSDLFIYLFI